MPSGAGQKRVAVSSLDASSSQSSLHASKKTRFVEPDDDPVNFAEQVDSALEDTSRRRGRIKTEGYESDSSDDGEGVVLSRKKGADGDDDMFALDDKTEAKTTDGSASKKKEDYMRLGDIEGQEFREEHGNASSDEDSEPEDEDDAERRKKAGMGYELSSFNMREEMEEGKFTEDGMYVRSFDAHAVHDRWMEGLDEKAIKAARKRKKMQDRAQEERMRAEEKELAESGGKSAMEKELLGLLKKGETVLEALQRIGARAKKLQPRSKRPGKANGPAEKQVGSDIDHITHLASNIMSLGDTDIYSKTYEELVRDVRSSGNFSPSWVPPSADLLYEYKWNIPEIAGQTMETFGPFKEDELKAWYKASYFGTAGEKVKVRVAGGDWGDWDDVVQ